MIIKITEQFVFTVINF